jgi:phage-related protein
MANTLTVDVDVNVAGLPDLKDVSSELDDVGKAHSNLGNVSQGVFQGIGQSVARMGTDLISSGVSFVIDGITTSIGLASDASESANKAQALFGSSYDTVAKAAEGSATSVGLSSGKYLELAGTLGNLTTNLGFTGDEAAGMSVDMLQLAGDLGSFNNADPTDVVNAMGAAFRGETEPIRQFGVFLDDATVKSKAMEMGLYDGKGAIDQNAKAQATYALILQQTGAAQGDFAKTSDGLANQQKINAAIQENAWASFGTALVPIATTFTQLLTPAIQGITTVLGFLADNIPTVIAVLIPLGIAIAATVVPPFVAWAIATLAATWPLLAIAAAVGAVVFILDQLGILDQIIGWFQTMANVVMAALKPAIDAVIGVFQQAVSVVQQIAQALSGPLDTALGVVRQAFDVVKGIIEAVAGALKGPLDAALGIVRAAFDVLKKAIDVVIGIIGTAIDIFTKVAGVLKGPVDLAIGVVKGSFDVLQKGISAAAGLINGVIDGVGKVFSALSTTASNVFSSIGKVFGDLWSGIQRTGQSISDFLGGIFKPLGDAINSVMKIVADAWNGFARFWNGLSINIPRINIPGTDVGVGGGSFGLPHLPLLAKGGIAMNPMLAGIAEKGPEAVIPLSRLPMGQTVNVYVTAGVGDPVAIGREIVEAIKSFERANGPAF